MAENLLTLPNNVNPLLKRAMLFLESGDFASATEYSGKVLDAEPENAFAYIVHLMAARNLQDEKQLGFSIGLTEDPDFKFARRFASPELAAKLDALVAETEKLEALKPLRAASAQRQKTLQQFLAEGLPPKQDAEVRQRIAAEQALSRMPNAAAAARETEATNALVARINECRVILDASFARQQILTQMLSENISDRLAAEVRQCIAAEQALSKAPDAAAAAREAAAVTVLTAKIELYRLTLAIRARLTDEGVSVSNAQAENMRSRLETAEALFDVPMPDLQTLQNEIQMSKAALTQTNSNKVIFIILIVALVVLLFIAVLFALDGYWGKLF